MTPASLVQTQQVLSVLQRAKPLQEQHLAEVFHRLLDQVSIISCIPATDIAAFNPQEESVADTGTANSMDRLARQFFLCAVHQVQLGPSGAAHHCCAV